MFYAQSWAVVHYLLLGRANQGGPLQFMPHHDTAPTDLEAAVRTYVDAGQFREVTVPSSLVVPARPVESEVSEARALAERAEMVVWGERPDAAVTLVHRSLALAPREPLALEVMGTYFFLRNQHDEARRWLTDAFDANHNNAASALYLALLSATPAERERYLMAAVRANAAMTVAWQRLGTIYEEDGRLDAMRRWCRLLLQGPLPSLLAPHLDRCQS
jgi:tetratricopeptide (TPR) repeat protein